MSPRSARRRSSIVDLLDPRFYAQGLGYFEPSLERTSLADLLEFLGDDEDERVEAVATLLRRSSAAERNELISVVQRALAKIDPERSTHVTGG